MKHLIEQTQQEFERKRRTAQTRALNRKDKIYAEIPALLELEKRTSDIGIANLAALHHQNHPTDVAPLDEIEKLTKQKNALLRAHGYTTADFEPKYSCTICNDTGYADGEQCICFKQAVAAKLYGTSSLMDVLELENFETFNFELYADKAPKGQTSPRDNIKNIYLECLNFATDFAAPPRNLLFRGRPGVGKTFMANCITAELLPKGIYIIYMPASELVDLIRKSRISDYSDLIDESFVDALATCDLLIIDDLGTENVTDFVITELFNLINKRILTNKQMLISTNLTLKEIEDMYSARIFSRIYGHFEIFDFIGSDIRVKKT